MGAGENPAPFSFSNLLEGKNMIRDIRDPQAIGAALEVQRAHSADEPIAQLADKILSGPIPNYGESVAQYRERVHATTNGDGQLAMFRAA